MSERLLQNRNPTYVRLIALCMILLLGSCATENNFFRQKYTHFSHVKHSFHPQTSTNEFNSEVLPTGDSMPCSRAVIPIRDSVNALIADSAEHVVVAPALCKPEVQLNTRKDVLTHSPTDEQQSVAAPYSSPDNSFLVMLLIMFAVIFASLLIPVFILSLLFGEEVLLFFLIGALCILGGLLVIMLIRKLSSLPPPENHDAPHENPSSKRYHAPAKSEVAKQNILILGICAVILSLLAISLLLFSTSVIGIAAAAGLAFVFLLMQMLWIRKLKKRKAENKEDRTTHEKQIDLLNKVATAVSGIFTGLWLYIKRNSL